MPGETVFNPEDTVPSLRDLDPFDNGRFPAARTYCIHSRCRVETTDDNPDHMFPRGVCNSCFGLSSEQCALMCGACNGRVDPEWCAHENCTTQLSWPDRVWNADDQVWEFVICCHCLGATSQFCAEHGGACGDSATAPRHRHRQGWSRAPGIEEGWGMDEDDLDEVTEDWDQSITAPPRSPRLSVVGQSFTSGQFHGFVRTSFQENGDRVVDTWNTVLIDSVRSGRIRTCTGAFGPVLVDPYPVHNEAGRFAMSPLILSNYQTLIRCLFSRIRQYCIAQQSVALNGWWAVGTLGLTDTVYTFETVYVSISGTLCSVSGLADMFGTVINAAESHQFIASCRLLAYHATLQSHRMLCWFLIPENIGCGLNSLLYLPVAGFHRYL